MVKDKPAGSYCRQHSSLLSLSSGPKWKGLRAHWSLHVQSPHGDSPEWDFESHFGSELWVTKPSDSAAQHSLGPINVWVLWPFITAADWKQHGVKSLKQRALSNDLYSQVDGGRCVCVCAWVHLCVLQLVQLPFYGHELNLFFSVYFNSTHLSILTALQIKSAWGKVVLIKMCVLSR